MAYTIPQYPSLNVLQATPEQLVIIASFLSTQDAIGTIDLADTFTAGCFLIDLDTDKWYKNEGSVAVPNFVEQTSGSGLPQLDQGHLWVGDANDDAQEVQMSGDASLDENGVLTLNDDVKVYTQKVTLTSAQILDANTTPVGIVSSGGPGTFLDILSITTSLDFATTPYATNVDGLFVLGTDTLFGYDLDGSASELVSLRKINNETPIAENASLFFSVDTGNPTAGDSDIDVYVTYKIVTL